MARLELARELHHIERADEIGLHIGARILQAVAHAGLRREMDDHVGRASLGGSCQRVHILEHGDRVTIGGVAQKDLSARLLEAGIVIGRHAVETIDDMARRQKPLREMKTDKSRRAGDENAHT